MKVMKGKSVGRPNVPHPKPMSGTALKEGISQLKSNLSAASKDEVARPGHRRGMDKGE